MSNLRIEPKTEMDRSIIGEWLKKMNYPVVTMKEEETNHIVIDVLSESFKATVILGGIKKFSNMRIVNLSTSVKAEKSAPGLGKQFDGKEDDKLAKIFKKPLSPIKMSVLKNEKTKAYDSTKPAID